MMKKLKFLKTNDIYNIYTFMMIMNKYKQSKQISISFIIFNKKQYAYKVSSFKSLPVQTMWLISNVSKIYF